MEPKHIHIIDEMYEKICRDLDVEEIITQLISNRVITDLFDEELRGMKGNQVKSRRLLSYLKNRGPDAYSKFKKALRQNHSWMVDEMEELEQVPFNGDDVTDASVVSNTPSLPLPEIPPLNVLRTKKMAQLSDELKKLEPTNYLALHAMPGWGKSTLVGATFSKDPSLYQCFKNEIYCIKFGIQQATANKDELSDIILNELNKLLHVVRNSYSLTEPTNRDSLVFALKKYFSDHNYALLILDHAEKREIIDAFDFDCKTLVLTTDIEVLAGKKCAAIKMEEGFTLKESLDLIAKAIGSEASRLPKQAKLMHEECKGMPLMISMYAAHFQEIKESLIQDKDGNEVWSAYLKDLRSQSPSLPESWKKLCATFEMCLKNLTNGDNNLYKMLSVFPEDVNITTKMLAIIWNIDDEGKIAIVNARMLTFYKKAMVTRRWNDDSGDYIYGVHDLMLRYLREKLGPEEMRKNHGLCVEKYLAKSNGDYSKLLRDNYIHAYIGYHIEEAGLTDKFSELYLNFGFIESKILDVGPDDLLIDLKKYRKHITRNLPELEEKVEDLKSFLIQQASTLAEYRRRNCLDIVQVALMHPNPGFVRENAERLANDRSERIYFKLSKKKTKDFDHVSVDLQMQVRSVALTNEAVEILAGTDDGKVVWWNCRNRRHTFLLSKTNATPITKIVYSETGKFFIALSEDGIAKLFDLKEPFDRQFENHQIKISEQWAKQENWKSMHLASDERDYSRTDLKITDQKITDITVSPDGLLIAACTATGGVAVWNSDGTVRAVNRSTLTSKQALVSIAYISLQTKLYVASLEDKSLIVLNASNCEYEAQYTLQSNSVNIISVIPVPEYINILVVLTEKRLFLLHWQVNEDLWSRPKMVPFADLDSSSTSSPFRYKSAVVMSDGKYVATSDTGGSVNVYNISDIKEPTLIRTFKKYVTSLDTRQFVPQSKSRTICGCTYETPVPMVHKWEFAAKEEGVGQRTPLFDAIVSNDNNGIIAVTTMNGMVKIMQNENEIAESNASDGRITSIEIFDDGKSVVYATENKSVWVFEIKQNETKKIMELPKATYYTKVLKVNDRNVIIFQNDDNDLKIWKGGNDAQLIADSGTVMLTAVLDDIGLILTVSNKSIKLWDQDKWSLQMNENLGCVNNIKCCSLSNCQNYLAITYAEGYIKVLKLSRSEFLPKIKFEKINERKLDCEITACCYSNDENLLAVGLKNGDILIIELKNNKDLRRIKFHSKPIRKLYWSPVNVKESILLSLSNELAWWSIKSDTSEESLTEVGNLKNGEGGIAHSKSEQTIRTKTVDSGSELSEVKKSASFHSDSGIVSLSERSNDTSKNSSSSLLSSDILQDEIFIEQNSRNSSRTYDLWNGKIGANSEIEDLLSVIKLDGNSATKIRMSNNFEKFITIDDEGSIYTINLLDQKLNCS